ncbi:hypothetical protein [Salmon gill poxvirus]|uniref:Uncharacterized protein n=1 Tax=Salmon gill poxvirus TaxID=1680908 RepID=A0A0H4XWP0_9POXV|nr:hypothetical protein AL387_gp144 [Salmon gill poxvirus]AKR04268.1 hypothetical protein SGPV144 [Salmon gill poxvirus]WMX26551.1 hypothetical protein [Salmon gill poxvirus]
MSMETGDIILTTCGNYFSGTIVPGKLTHCCIFFGKNLKTHIRNYFLSPKNVTKFYNSGLYDRFGSVAQYINSHNNTDLYTMNYFRRGAVFVPLTEILERERYLVLRTPYLDTPERKAVFNKKIKTHILDDIFKSYFVLPDVILSHNYTYCFKSGFQIHERIHKELGVDLVNNYSYFMGMPLYLSTTFLSEFDIVFEKN